MKILQINKFYYLRGGSERYFFDLAEILKENGHKVIPFSMLDSRNKMSDYDEYFITKVNLDKFSIKNIIKIFYNYEAVRKLKKLIKEERPDIAHLHNIYHQISPAIISVLKKEKIPIVMTLHDYKIICPNTKLFDGNKICKDCLKGKYYNCALKKCVKKSFAKSLLATLEAYWHNKILKTYDQVDLFIAPSEYMKNVCVEAGIPENKIKVVYNFVRTSLFSPPLSRGPARMTQSGRGAGGEDYILYFGRLSPEKGVDVLLEAMKKVRGRIKLKIVGAGAERNNYELRIMNYELFESVELAGPKHGEELKNIILNAEAVVVPSIWPENMPMSILEAMAFGKAVIASNAGGIPEIIKDGETGFLFSPGDADELAAKICEVLKREDSKTIGLNAINSISKLNESGHYEEIRHIYDLLACEKQ